MNNKSLDKIAWEVFEVKDIFDIFTGAFVDKNDFKEGKIPRITATDNNNGISFFTDKSCHKNFRTFENFISISFLGSVFYQKELVSLDMKIHGIKPKNYTLNKYIALFLIPLIKNFTFKYRYGYQLSTSILKTQKILLPIDDNNNPDWEFMEKYMVNEESKILKKTIASYEKKIINDNSYNLKLKDFDWQEFDLKDIFPTIKRGKRLTKVNQISGDIPYISSTGLNNGVDNFISNTDDVRKFRKCLSLANSGSVGATFYHPYEYIASDHVTNLSLDHDNNNKHIYLFLATIIKRLNEKYSFNREINDERIKKEKIILPINSAGKINWEFMKNYMINEEQKYIKKILSHLKSI